MDQYCAAEIQLIRERLRLYFNVQKSRSSKAYTFRELIREIAPLIPDDSDLNQHSFDGNYIFKEDGFVNFINRRQSSLKPDAMYEIQCFLEDQDYLTGEELSIVRKLNEFPAPSIQTLFLSKPSLPAKLVKRSQIDCFVEGEYATEKNSQFSQIQVIICAKQKRINATKSIHFSCSASFKNNAERYAQIRQSLENSIELNSQTKHHGRSHNQDSRTPKPYIGTIVNGEDGTMLLLEYSVESGNLRSDNLYFESNKMSFFSQRSHLTYRLTSQFNRRITNVIGKILVQTLKWIHDLGKLQLSELVSMFTNPFIFDNVGKSFRVYQYSSVSPYREFPKIQISYSGASKSNTDSSNELITFESLPQAQLDLIFISACEHNDPYIAFEALLSGANVNSISQASGFSAMHWAAHHKSDIILDILLCDKLEDKFFEKSFLVYFLFQHGEISEIKAKWRSSTLDFFPLVLDRKGRLPSRCIDGVKIVPKTDKERRISFDFCRILQNELRVCAKTNVDMDFVFFNTSENGHFTNISR